MAEKITEDTPERATDKELVDFWIGHIDGPCEVEVAGKIENMRESYIREVETHVIPNLTDDAEKQRLINKIKEYKK